ncbi:hypothetical protein K492DRAFT_178136, partial [Lichtheimia hyalospora FSU 10163]
MLNPNAIEFKPSPTTDQQPKSESSHSSRRSSKATTHGKQRSTQVNNTHSSSNAKQKKKQHVKQQQPSRRKGRRDSLPVSKETQQHASSFDQPAKFITIEETIDPLCQLSIKDRSEKKIVHGYERYIEWV